MYKSSSLCLYSSNLGTFWLKIKPFWPFEEISIFSNGGHLGWRAWLSDITFKGNPLRMIQAKWFQRRRYLKKFTDRRPTLKTRNFTTSTFLFFWYLDEPQDHSVWYNSSNYKNWGEKTLSIILIHVKKNLNNVLINFITIVNIWSSDCFNYCQRVAQWVR
jgi:hypothetical protein